MAEKFDIVKKIQELEERINELEKAPKRKRVSKAKAKSETMESADGNG
ncbi:MAG: hypothetical protein GY753_12765 [Gammaproteobacteria bacterium]|nr:hypothetical protein [Gammaproteobacteria bacterium]